MEVATSFYRDEIAAIPSMDIAASSLRAVRADSRRY